MLLQLEKLMEKEVEEGHEKRFLTISGHGMERCQPTIFGHGMEECQPTN